MPSLFTLRLLVQLSLLTMPVAPVCAQVNNTQAEAAPPLERQVLNFSVDKLPRRLTVKRGMPIEFHGSPSSRSLASRIELRQGNKVVARADASQEWRLTWNSRGEFNNTCSLSLVQVEANRTERKLSPVFVTLYDTCPVKLEVGKSTNEVTEIVDLRAVSPDSVEVEHYQVYIDGEDAKVELGQSGLGQVSLQQRTPGEHSLKVRVTLGSGGGELFTDPVRIKLLPVAEVQTKDNLREIDLRTSLESRMLPLAVKLSPTIKAKSVTYYLEESSVGKSDLAPFDTLAIDGARLYAGQYQLHCIVYTEDGKVFLSDTVPINVLRDGKAEYRKYLKAVTDRADSFNEQLTSLVKEEQEYSALLLEMNSAKKYGEWNAAMNDCVRHVDKLSGLYAGFDKKVLDSLVSTPIPYGVPRQFHPQLRKAFELIASNMTLRQEGWRRESKRLSTIVWSESKHQWVYNGNRIAAEALGVPGNYTSRSQRDYEEQGEKNRAEGLAILAEVPNKL